MRSINRMLVISIILVSAGLLIVFGTLFLSRQKDSQYPPEKKSLAPTVPPTLIATPTLAGQRAICTYYIHATSHEASPKGLALTQADSGKTFTVDIGTLLILFCEARNFHISTSSFQNIFAGAGSPMLPIHLPVNAVGAYRVIRAGFGTMQVIGTE